MVLFYFRATKANFWSLLNNMDFIFGKSLYYTASAIYFLNPRSPERPGLIIETLEYVDSAFYVKEVLSVVCLKKLSRTKSKKQNLTQL